MPLDDHATRVLAALKEVALHNPDQILATNAADTLLRTGSLRKDHKVPAGLHPEWARAQISSNVTASVFAATNVHDPAVLAQMVYSEKRVTVLRAILANVHADDPTRQICIDRLHLQDRRIHTYVLIPASLCANDTFIINAARDLRDLPDDTLAKDGPVADVATLIARCFALNPVGTARGVICGYYGPDSGYENPTRLFNALGYHPLDLLEAVDPDERSDILAQVLSDQRDSTLAPVNRWDAALINQLIYHQDELRTEFINARYRGPTQDTLEPEALELVLATPTLHNIIRGLTLNEDNVAPILAAVDEDLRRHLIDNILTDPDFTSVAIAKAGRAVFEDAIADLDFDDLIRGLNGPCDPSFLGLVKHASFEELIEHLYHGTNFTGTTADYYKKQFSPPEDVAQIAALVLASAPDVTALAACVRSTYFVGPTDSDYVRALCDHLPGAWENLIGNPVFHDIIVARLAELPVPELIERLFTDDTLIPRTMLEILNKEATHAS